MPHSPSLEDFNCDGVQSLRSGSLDIIHTTKMVSFQTIFYIWQQATKPQGAKCVMCQNLSDSQSIVTLWIVLTIDDSTVSYPFQSFSCTFTHFDTFYISFFKNTGQLPAHADGQHIFCFILFCGENHWRLIVVNNVLHGGPKLKSLFH